MLICFYVFRFIQAMLVIPEKLYEQFTRETIQYLGPVFSTAQNFVCSGKKLVNGKPSLNADDFFHLPKFSQLLTNFKDPIPSKTFGGLQFFVRRQHLLFFDSYPSSGNLFSRT